MLRLGTSFSVLKAPQKIMWMAWDKYRQTKRGGNVKIDFYTGMPTMFSVKKYSDALNDLRVTREVGGYFKHNLVSINASNHKATFKKADESTVDVDFTLLHVTPPMGPLDFLRDSPIVDAAGWVDGDKGTLRHVKPEFGNIFSLGDCSSLPTSKTAAAIASQAPVLTENLFSVMDTGKVSSAIYDGYTSCPVSLHTCLDLYVILSIDIQLLTGYNQLMLAEFKYGLEPKETFSQFFDQTKPNRSVDFLVNPCYTILNTPNVDFSTTLKRYITERLYRWLLPRLIILFSGLLP